ncbi:MAG: hypothetical protein IKT67_00660 [Lachnospiraceae bacterium]|nr:hypothetical protein [Lachnospiraceae bacterium]
MEEKVQVIPKIIHYCWFGGNPIPEDLQECIDSWKQLEGYTLMRWDESNCTFDENEYIKKAYAEKKFAYISDYYRLKALDEYGGIYLDTDAKVFKSFDPLLHHEVFFNFIYDCSVGLGVIGAQKGSKFIKALLEMYDKTVFGKTANGKVIEYIDGKIVVNGFITNNYYCTYYILKNYPEFRLNNKYQDMGDFAIYPKELFEIGTLSKRHYVIHYSVGAWRVKKEQSATLKGKIKQAIQGFPKLYEVVQIIVRKIRYRKANKRIPFYPYSVAQKKGQPLPEL